jgi:hypothetical protein
MKRLLLLLCALVPCACKPASEATPNPRPVSRVTFQKSSGPVAVPWSEHVEISRMGILFRRTGEPNSAINVGSWEMADAAGVSQLFERLSMVDCSQIREIPPDEAPDGGGATSYLVQYDDGSSCSIWYRQGITYSGAEPLVDAIDEFIRGLSLPAGASSLFVSP